MKIYNNNLRIIETLENIYTSRNKNPLYRNLKNRYLNIDEKAIALSSLITKILISCSKIDDIEERKRFVKSIKLEEINKAINEYIILNKKDKLEKCSEDIRIIIEKSIVVI